jgi:1-pyrroline-5-carboxylate dehydrogenase
MMEKTMHNMISNIPTPYNEPVLSHGPGTLERETLKSTLADYTQTNTEVPLVIDGKRITTDKHLEVRPPHKHHQVVGTLFQGTQEHIQQAIDSCLKARADWANTSYDARAAIFLKAADLLCGPYRAKINATTMLCQSKTAHQAEIDAACELADFWRFNVHYGRQILEDQPISSNGLWNQVDYRPLDGFVTAVSPFNFTSIAGNLPTAPALMGNTVVWKPATTAALSNQVIMDLLLEAGLPAGVINVVHVPGIFFGDVALKHPDLSGIHFTGSTPTFQRMWSTVGAGIADYNAYPRLVGETGGKDFIFAHPSADVRALAVAMVRGAFEYQGQKCSAASRAYIPESLWPELSGHLESEIAALKMGDVADFSNFMGAVIDAKAFTKISGYIDHAKDSSDAQVWLGGDYSDGEGYFISPTVILADKPDYKSMCEEIFGPILTVHRYPDNKFEEMLTVCDKTSPYALTGAIFSQDRAVVTQASQALRFSAGNFYVNDKPTGAVVGQQPFGGSRASGTNDKAGSRLNLLRWASPRTIKETFVPPKSVGYPYMDA